MADWELAGLAGLCCAALLEVLPQANAHRHLTSPIPGKVLRPHRLEALDKCTHIYQEESMSRGRELLAAVYSPKGRYCFVIKRCLRCSHRLT